MVKDNIKSILGPIYLDGGSSKNLAKIPGNSSIKSNRTSALKIYMY